jgi:hypothetical protein
MIRAGIRGAKAMEAALRSAMPEVTAPASMRKIGEQAAAMIKLRSRLGHGVPADGQEKARFKPLAESTVKARQRGALHSETTPKRSNLTRSGQLLDSEGVTKVDAGKVSVGPSGQRSDGKTNEQVAQFVTAAGRAFNHLSKVELKRLQDEVKKLLRETIKRALTKR